MLFDVDGTLFRSTDAEAICFPQACEEGLGISNVSRDWDTYRHPSDTGIVEELVETRLGRRAEPADFERVQECFLARLAARFAEHPHECTEVPGALAAWNTAIALPDTVVGIATGGWSRTARFKLATAGFAPGAIPFASAEDAVTKARIITVAMARAKTLNPGTAFASITYVGDLAGDAEAARSLGISFVAMDTAGALGETTPRFTDYRDAGAFFSAVAALRGRPVSVR